MISTAWITQAYPPEIVEWVNVLTASVESGGWQEAKQRRLQAIIRTPEVVDGFARAFENVRSDDAKARKGSIDGFKRFVEDTAGLPDQSPLGLVEQPDYGDELENDLDDRSRDEILERTGKLIGIIADLQYAYKELHSKCGAATEEGQDSPHADCDDIRPHWILRKIDALAMTHLKDWDRDRVVPAVFRTVLPDGT